ncbi:MAG: glycosyltransferase [Methanomicrobiales archaeon]|nr:glycosyltransferase [Methanomicrobiales archaeon]
MKILLIADGRSIHAQRWAAYFGSHHEVHFITYDPLPAPIAGVTEYVVESRFRNHYLAFLPRHCRIHRIIRRVRPDLIHAHFIAKYGFHLPLLRASPSIVSAWGDDVLILPKESSLIRWYTRRVLTHVDRIYAISHDLANHIRDDFQIPEKKIRYMPFGVDTRIFSPRERDRAGDIVQVFSNRGFFPVYNTAALIQGFALAHAKNSCLRLVLKGEGPEKDAMMRLVTELELSEVITFAGRTEYAQVLEDLRTSDIFATTSRSDGTPVSLLEAMSVGLPCIASAVGGIPEWIRNGENGFLIPSGDQDACAQRLLQLASDPALRERLGRKARETVQEKGDWWHLMQEAEKDYARLVNG